MMSFLASLFPHKQQNQPHQSCGCVCHEDTTVTRPTTWLERIRRRSSISSTQLLYENSSTESVQCSVEEKNLNDFTDLYDLAVDEVKIIEKRNEKVILNFELYRSVMLLNSRALSTMIPTYWKLKKP